MELQSEKKLNEKGISFRLIKLEQAAISVEDVVTFSNSEVVLEEICKTVIVKGRKTGELYGVLIQGTDRLNSSKLKKIFGEEVTMGNVAEVREVAGVEPGAVCPFLLKVPLLVDLKIMGLSRINCGSGDHLFVIELNQDDLKKVVEYTVGDFVK